MKEILYWMLNQEPDFLWQLGKAFHEALDPVIAATAITPRIAYWHPFCWFWQIWWRLGYRWVYPFMWKAKAERQPFAQKFGEGY